MNRRLVVSLFGLPLLLLSACAAPPQMPPAPAPGTDARAPIVQQAEATPDPSPTPVPDLTLGYRRPVFPEDAPLPTLTGEQQAAYGDCLTTTITSGSGGDCAALLQDKLTELGYFTGKKTSRLGVAAVNALLRYQRSRELPATGNAAERTWYALASEQPARSEELPAECTIPGVVLCVDQAHDTLRWIRDGEVVKTIKVRTGGFITEPKTGKWRVHATVNGFYRVYNKHRNPKSENYGAGAMPYAVMFDPNMYFHYSSDFAKRGYATSSHGCVNIGSKEEAKWVFDNTPIDARVLIY
ncbi:MAG: L,D-transpeptidase family protein [Propioniciclava sp.]|uniref:L,D-transpeptidase family protein n=1 Tax=Propioniciclava sp. TaxID=2038686 RepID=UPI0039E25E33